MGWGWEGGKYPAMTFFGLNTHTSFPSCQIQYCWLSHLIIEGDQRPWNRLIFKLFKNTSWISISTQWRQVSEIWENKGKGVEQTTALFRETTGSGKKQHNSSQLTMLSMETPFVFIFIQIYMTSKNNQHSMFCSNQFLIIIILNSA